MKLFFEQECTKIFFWIFSQPQTMCAATPIRRKIVKIMIMQFNFSLWHFRIKALRSVWQLNHPVLHMRIRRRKKKQIWVIARACQLPMYLVVKLYYIYNAVMMP